MVVELELLLSLDLLGLLLLLLLELLAVLLVLVMVLDLAPTGGRILLLEVTGFSSNYDCKYN